MKPTLVCLALCFVEPTFAIGKPTRRGIFGWLGGGVVTLTSSPTPARTPAPPAPKTISLDVITRARARQLRVEYAKSSTIQVFADGDSRRVQRADDPRRIERRLGSRDVDVVHDWSVMTPEGRARGDVVRQWTEAVSAETPDQQMLERTEKILRAAITEGPWSSFDWVEVFGTRLAVAELDIHAQTGLELFDVQRLIKLLISSAPSAWARKEFLLNMMRRPEHFEHYSRANLEIVLQSLGSFAPHLTTKLREFHLEVDRWPELRSEVRKELGGEMIYSFREASDNYPVLLRAGTWQQEMIDYDRPIDAVTEGVTADFSRRANLLEICLEWNLRAQAQLLATLEGYSESPLRTALIEDLRYVTDQTTFELATLPDRLQARAVLATAFRATLEDSNLVPKWQALTKQIPAPESRAWAGWRPPPSLVEFADPAVHPQTVEDFTRVLNASAHVGTWAAGWLRRVLSEKAISSGEVLAWLTEPSRESEEMRAAEPAGPLALEHRPVDVLDCGKDLERPALEPVTSPTED